MENTINELLANAVIQLNQRLLLSDTARLDAELLMSHILGKPRSYLFAWPEKVLSDSDTLIFQKSIAKRAEGYPIAYLVGEKNFWTVNLKVDDNVLIPRPDTELIVELALSRPLPDDAIVADLGTGSGAISLALAGDRPSWMLYGTDNSSEALSIASKNARINKYSNVAFLLGDWCLALGNIRPNMIVTNPPYIPKDDPHLKQGDIRFEPLSALISGKDGLDAIRHIIKESKAYLLPGGWLLIEHGFNQGEGVRQLLKAHGYHQVSTAKDLSGHDRVTLATRPIN